MKRQVEAPVVVPYKTNVKIWATGRWGGGRVKIRDGKRELAESLEINGHAFAVLAVLMYHGHHDDPNGANWVSRGFMTKCEIASLAWKLGGIRIAADEVARHIHHLRKALAALWRDPRKGHDCAMNLVEHCNLGYRLSTRGDNLHLQILRNVSQASSSLSDDGKAPGAPTSTAIQF